MYSRNWISSPADCDRKEQLLRNDGDIEPPRQVASEEGYIRFKTDIQTNRTCSNCGEYLDTNASGQRLRCSCTYYQNYEV